MVFATLEAGRKETRLERAAYLALMLLIAVNVIAVGLEPVPSYQTDSGDVFCVIEIFSVAVFTIEYVLRAWSVPEHPAVKFTPP